jgi:hypothetical protein
MCMENEPLAHCFNKYNEYDPTPKRRWYRSAEDCRLVRVQYEGLSTKGGR